MKFQALTINSSASFRKPLHGSRISPIIGSPSHPRVICDYPYLRFLSKPINLDIYGRAYRILSTFAVRAKGCTKRIGKGGQDGHAGLSRLMLPCFGKSSESSICSALFVTRINNIASRHIACPMEQTKASAFRQAAQTMQAEKDLSPRCAEACLRHAKRPLRMARDGGAPEAVSAYASWMPLPSERRGKGFGQPRTLREGKLDDALFLLLLLQLLLLSWLPAPARRLRS